MYCYTLSLHDALPICWKEPKLGLLGSADELGESGQAPPARAARGAAGRSAALAGRCQTQSGGCKREGHQRRDALRLRLQVDHAVRVDRTCRQWLSARHQHARHHQTMIQALPLTLGVERGTWVVLDALRKKRNVND